MVSFTYRENSEFMIDDHVKTLEVERNDAVLWQTILVPGQPLFQLKQDYGKGCPWSCGHYQNRLAKMFVIILKR